MPAGEELYQEVSEAVRKSRETKQRLEDGRKKDATMLRAALQECGSRFRKRKSSRRACRPVRSAVSTRVSG